MSAGQVVQENVRLWMTMRYASPGWSRHHRRRGFVTRRRSHSNCDDTELDGANLFVAMARESFISEEPVVLQAATQPFDTEFKP